MAILDEIKSNNLVELKLKNKMLLEKIQVDYLNKLDKEFNVTPEEVVVYALKKLNIEKIYKGIKKEKESVKNSEPYGKNIQPNEPYGKSFGENNG